MEPLDCSCRYFVDPKAPKWSPWGAAGSTLGVLWGPRTLKMGPWEPVGTLWGVKGVRVGSGDQKVLILGLILEPF